MSYYKLFSIFPNYDPFTQLKVIRHIIKMTLDYTKRVGSDIKDAENNVGEISKIPDEYKGMVYDDMIYNSFYSEASLSMAAVGTIAPFIEGIFTHFFEYAEQKNSIQTIFIKNDHERWQSFLSLAFNPHFYLNSGKQTKDFVNGAIQILEASELKSYFPNELKSILEPLFAYRNKMFHCGYEWPEKERKKFKERIEKQKWDDWFECVENCYAKKNNEIWLIYMKECFIEKCLETANNILNGFCAILDVIEKSALPKRSINIYEKKKEQ